MLDLKPPISPSLNRLIALWPTAASYAVSYLFVAIAWIDHRAIAA